MEWYCLLLGSTRFGYIVRLLAEPIYSVSNVCSYILVQHYIIGAHINKEDTAGLLF